MRNNINIRDFEIIVIGGSAGSVKVLSRLIPVIPENFPVPIIIVVHRKAGKDSILAEILKKKAKIKVKEAEDKEPVQPGIIYLAPPDYHLLLDKNRTINLDYSEKELYSRPNIDLTFTFASHVYKEKMLGILLSGANEDGSEGVKHTIDYGGCTIVQHPADAEVDTMPRFAIAAADVKHILTVDEIIELFTTDKKNSEKKKKIS